MNKVLQFSDSIWKQRNMIFIFNFYFFLSTKALKSTYHAWIFNLSELQSVLRLTDGHRWKIDRLKAEKIMNGSRVPSRPTTCCDNTADINDFYLGVKSIHWNEFHSVWYWKKVELLCLSWILPPHNDSLKLASLGLRTVKITRIQFEIICQTFLHTCTTSFKMFQISCTA